MLANSKKLSIIPIIFDGKIGSPLAKLIKLEVKLVSRVHVNHSTIVRFADERVNLKREDAKELRRQANMLRDKLESYLSEHSHFDLRKMLLSGSLAKGTALKSISDIDVACYVAANSAPHLIVDLIPWLTDKLRKAFPNFKPEQVKPKTYSVGSDIYGDRQRSRTSSLSSIRVIRNGVAIWCRRTPVRC